MHLVYPPPPPPPPQKKTNKQNKHFQFLLGITVFAREIQDNGYAKLGGGLSFFPPSHCPRDCEGIQHEMLTEDSVVLSPTGDGTAICTVRGHLSHLNIEPFAGQMKYLPLWLFYDRE